MKFKHFILALGALLLLPLLQQDDAEAGTYLIAILTDDIGNRVYGTPMMVDDADEDGTNADEAEEVVEVEDNAEVEPDSYGGKTKGNNGHGNNADGFDSSNPGNKKGVDQSCQDPDNCVDDEAGGGKGKKK